MTIEFITRKDASGNRYYLGIDVNGKTFSRERKFSSSLIPVLTQIEVSKRERKKIIEKLMVAGFSEID